MIATGIYPLFPSTSKLHTEYKIRAHQYVHKAGLKLCMRQFMDEVEKTLVNRRRTKKDQQAYMIKQHDARVKTFLKNKVWDSGSWLARFCPFFTGSFFCTVRSLPPRACSIGLRNCVFNFKLFIDIPL